jgi:TolB-like protein/Tfp pilus assembly protein PilF
LIIHDAAMLSDLKRETRRCLELTHKNIVRIYDFVHDERSGCISMEYIDGDTLSKLRCDKERKVFEAPELSDWLSQLCDALDYAHNYAHIIHRDLKPANLMVNQRGELKVSDFGIARSVGDSMSLITMAGGRSGTLAYMSPQQLEGQRGTHLDDIYSLGASVYELLTSKPPFYVGNIDRQIREKIPPSMTERRKEFEIEAEPIPVVWEEWVAACLAKDSGRRPQSVRDIARQLQMPSPKARQPTTRLFFPRKKKRVLALGLAGVGVIVSAIAGFFLLPRAAPHKIDKSIAVLPFENLSEEKGNAYFAEGMKNEILTKLASVRDLKVISRTSTAKYQSKPDNLKKVAQELGVSTVLEGAVQKAGDKVRVNVQLIDARADTHLWAKSYDRDLKDVFAVESEVSQEIAEALQANLSPSESHALASIGTRDAEAYDLFLRGEYEFHQAESSFPAAEVYDRADAFYQQALARDPNFAEAAAELARTRLRRHHTFSPLTAAELEEVKSLIDRALALAPNSPEAHLALGVFFYFGHRQYENALTEFNRALELQPNNALARQYCAYVYRRRGEWERTLADLQRAEQLDPRDAQIPTGIGDTYLALRQWKDAERAELRALAIDPHNAAAAINLVRARVLGTGDLESGRRALDDFPEATKDFLPTGATGIGDVAPMLGSLPVILDVFERRFTDAFQAFEKKVVNDDRARLQLLAGRAALRVLAGESEAAKSAGEEARPLLEARLRERPDDIFAMTGLSWVYLALGRNADALRLSKQAADTVPIEKDAFSGPYLQLGLAQIEARSGAPEEAIKRLRHLLSIPVADVTIARLKIDPVWDPIRDRPDFQQLLSGPEQIGPGTHVEPTAAGSPEPTTAPEKSIAVLPFDNLSRDPDNAYFAEGVQNEILTRLATVRDLKVISRTSTAKYQSKPDNLKKVAQELGVSTVLEGAVQKVGDKVRVNVQLIDARADTHLWAKSYDRDLKDVLGVESEVSQEIAEALQANLSSTESHALASVGTRDAEAYDLFLRGEYELHQAESSLAAEAYDRADAFYRQALARDPNFAEAAEELARSQLSRHWFLSPLTVTQLEEVKSLIDRTLALAPNSPEAHFALGLFFYLGHRQYENALTEFNRALELQPNNSLARQYRANVYRRRGEWERSLADSQRAEELDPRDAEIPNGIGETYLALRQWKDAERAASRALAIDPHHSTAAADLLLTRLWATGDVDSARRALDGFRGAIKSITRSTGAGVETNGDVVGIIHWPYVYVIERRFTDAFQAFEKEEVNDDRARLQHLAGRVALRVLAEETEAAKSAGEEARPLLEARLREQPDDAFAMTGLSWVYLALGRNADALRISRQAADSISIEKDALTGPLFQNGLAQIEARAGAPEEAIKRLRRLLSIPAGAWVSTARLKIDPVWDPIRNRPDFQQLLSGPEQVGPNK